MTRPRAVLVGLGGYGNFYLEHLLTPASPVELVAGVDPQPARCRHLDALHAAGVAVVPDLAALPAGLALDVAIVATPIHLHAAQTVALLARGCHVLCEKPVAPTVQDALRMQRAEAASGRRVAIGYQWSYSRAITALKRDVAAGRLGAPRRLRTLVLWNRDDDYYARSPWAGALRTADGGWVLDSPVSNATAHFLHNMLFVLGTRPELAAAPATVQAELHRANRIGNFDAAVLRVRTVDGVACHMATAHCADRALDPVFTYEFADATVGYRFGAGITARFADGRVVRYGDPEDDLYAKVAALAAHARGGTPIACGLAAALPHLIVANGAQECRAVAPFPPDRVVHRADERRVEVPGLAADFHRLHAEAALPSELGLPWAVPGTTVDLRGYARFPSQPRAWL